MRLVALGSLALVLAATVGSAQDGAREQSLEARRLAAEASFHARRAYFALDGTPPLEISEAFPTLAFAPIADPLFVAARRDALAELASARADERLAVIDDELRPLLLAACDAEDAADALELRLLAALDAGLSRAPGLHQSSLDAAAAPWRAQLAEARRVARDDPAWPEASRSTLEAVELERRLWLYRDAAIGHMSVPGDSRLSALVREDLEGQLLAAATRDRLDRALPLLPPELAELVRERLRGASATLPAQRARATAAREQVAEASTTELSELRSTIAETREAELARHESALADADAFAARVRDMVQSQTVARGLSILDPSRDAELRQVFSAAQATIVALRESIEETVELSTRFRAERVRVSRDWTERVDDTSSAETRVALTELEGALLDRETTVSAERARLMAVLDESLSSRRELIPVIDYPTRRRLYPDELRAELLLARRWIRDDVRRQYRYVQTMPERAFDVTAVWDLLTVSFDLLLLFLAWAYLHRAGARFLRRSISGLRARELSRHGWQGAPRFIPDSEISSLARHAVAAVVALVAHYLLLPRSELLALAALVWLVIELLRSVPSGVRLLLAVWGRALDPLSAVNPSSPEVESRGERTAKWFLLWWGVSEVVIFIAVPLLQADALHYTFTVASWAVLPIFVVYALSQWAAWVRAFIQHLADQSKLTAWLSRPARSRLSGIVLAGGGVVFIAARVVFWFLVDIGWVTRSGTDLVVSQLRVMGADAEPLEASSREAIRSAEAPLIERTEALTALTDAVDAWKAARRQGVVAVIGDRGMGKSSFLESARPKLESKELVVTSLTVPERPRSKSFAAQLAWLTEPLGIAIPKNSSADAIQRLIVEQLEAEPPRVLLVDDLHFLLTRKVGGFELMHFVIHVVQACSNEHFWVLALHRPAWAFVEGFSGSTKLAFRHRIELSGLDPTELEVSLVARARQAGYEPSFDGLMRRQTVEVDPVEVAEKARRMYWRLLFQSSLGNPRVALHYWLASLGSAEDENNGEPECVPVYYAPAHSDSEVETMTDEYLFLLTALMIHDGLAPDDVSEILNLPRDRARISCQHLESLNILVRDGPSYTIAPEWQPAVVRVLNRKNFAHH